MRYAPDFSSRFRILKGGKISLVVSALLTSATLVHAAPTGGTVTTGSASISQSGSTTTINQSSNKASINWQSFSIAPSETVNFVQPSASSVTLNRVVGTTSSLIQGAMNANGQVILVNPNGVVFTEGATVNVGGLVATTKNITDTDFQNGNYVFQGDSDAGILNMGTITTAQGGYVAMMAKSVQNQGTITATLGRVELAGGNKFTLNLNGNSLLNLTIDEGALNTLVENGGLIKADGGQVYLTTQALNSVLDGMVNNTGVIQAQSMSNQNGEIVLYAHGGTLNAGGTLDTGSGTGHVETSGEVFYSDNTLHVNTGSWLIDPTDLTIDSTLASTIQTSLNGGANVTESATNDITVNSTITWNTAKTLTLSAGNNIHINAALTSSNAAGKVVLEYGQAATDGYTNNDGYDEARYDFGLTSSGFAGSINLQSGQNFSTKLGSTGTAINYTVINDATALQNMTLNDYTVAYALGSNIDLTAWQNANGGNWTSIGSSYSSFFSGKLDGLGHTVSNLTQNITGDYAGLFGYVTTDATIKNIGVTNVNITLDNTGSDLTNKPGAGALAGYGKGDYFNVYATGYISGYVNVGGLIGYANASIISSFTTTDIESSGIGLSGQNYGGLAGYATNTWIENSYAKGTVDAAGRAYVGGLVGYTRSGNVIGSYSEGNVYGTVYVGGLVGYTNTATSFWNVYSTGAVTGLDVYTGGLIGYANNVNIQHAYHKTGAVIGNGDYTGGLIGYSDDIYLRYAYASGVLDSNGNDTGIATKSNNTNTSYAITGGGNYTGGLIGYNTNGSTIKDVYATGNVTSEGQGVGGLIGQNGNSAITDSYATGVVTSTWAGAGGLIGYNYDSSITNSYATGNVNSAGSAGGLIAENETWNGTHSITNSYATGDIISDGRYVGGLVGKNYESAISNSHATGDITATTIGSNTRYRGGLVGYNTSSNIDNSYATGSVTGLSELGGLIGSNLYNSSISTISNSYATGNVTGNSGYVGGLVGNMDGAIIQKSYATGNVSGTDYLGGLVGFNNAWPAGTIENSYATGSVTSNNTGAGMVGGLVGDNRGTIQYSYSTGTVSSSHANTGGLVGYNDNGTITDSYYDKTVNTGMADESTSGKTTAEMKLFSTYPNTWDIVVDSSLSDIYPKLRWATNGLNAGTSEWVIGKKGITYSVSGATQTYGTAFTLPTPSFNGGTPTGTVEVKVFNSSNVDVTVQALAGTLPAGTYTVKTFLTDDSYAIASSGNSNGTLIINSSINVSEIVTNIVNNSINNSVNNTVSATTPITQPTGETQNSFERRVVSTLVNVGSDKSLGNVATSLDSVIRNTDPTINNIVTDSRVTLVGQTGGEGEITRLTLDQITAKSHGGELRVALSPDSFVELVNGGVTLPKGVSQEFYVVADKQ